MAIPKADLEREQLIEDNLVSASLALRNTVGTFRHPEAVNYAISVLDQADTFLLKYMHGSSLPEVQWSMQRLLKAPSDSLMLFTYAKVAIMKKLDYLGFRIPLLQKTPWEQKMLQRLQLTDKVSSSQFELAKRGGNPNQPPKK